MPTPTAEASSTERRKLRSALRTLRSDAGLTQEQVAAEMDWSLSKLIRIETGAVTVSTNDVHGLLRLYGVTDSEQTSKLLGLAKVARLKPWWYAYRDHFAPGFQSYLDLEAGASTLKFYQPALIPGLFQTEDYARAVITSTATEGFTSEDLELEVKVRLKRQEAVFEREEPPSIVAILDEAVLRRICGSTAIMTEQLRYLASMVQRSRASIRVVPFARGGLLGSYGTFIILEFPDDADEPAAYIEGVASVQVVRSQPQITNPYLRLFEKALTHALSEEDSVRFVDRIADELA
jgi:transcriptional regulator with XRE-family HTH domain